MPRISRVRLHNVLYEKGNRVFDNLILNLSGHDGLLILQNGGGKTLLLHLIAQTVIPNVRLQKRRLGTLVAENSFTGHVLVEWLLDTDPPRYLLSGFCFAESLGSANRELDYFTYLSEYGQSNPWDLNNFPLVGEGGRTLNYQQLRKLLRTAGIQVRTFSADRRRDYWRELRSYNIDPSEWGHVLTTNSSEGGVGKFFEACSKTPQLLDRLLIPTLDSVCGRSQDETDALTQAFRQVAEELMTLPELKANCEALGQLVERLPKLNSALQEVEAAWGKEGEAERALESLLATFKRGIHELGAEDGKLAETEEHKKKILQEIDFELAGITVEEKRRQLEQHEQKLLEEETKVQVAQEEFQAADDKYRRCLAQRLWQQSEDKKTRFREEQERERIALKGRAAQAEEITELRAKLWPLHQFLTNDLQAKLDTATAELNKTEDAQRAVKADKENLIQQQEQCRLKREKLRGQGEEFDRRRQTLAAKLAKAGWAANLTLPEPAITWVNTEKEQAETARQRAQAAYNTAQEEISSLQKEMQQLKAQEGERGEGLKRLVSDHNRWKEELLSVQELLALIGMSLMDSAADPYAQELPLLHHAEQLEAERIRLELEIAQLKQRQALLGTDDGAVLANIDTAKLQTALTKQGLPTTLGTAWLQALDDDTLREEYVGRFPWLPYALIAEEEQLLRFAQRRPKIKEDLSAAVPLVARQTLNLTSEPNIGLHFVQHEGLQLFIYPAKVKEILAGIDEQVQDRERRLDELKIKIQHCRQAADRLTQLRRNSRYHTDEQWATARQQAAAALQEVRDDCNHITAKIEELKRQQETAQQAGEQARGRLTALSNLLGDLENYRIGWSRNQEREEQIAMLGRQEAEIGKKAANLETEEKQLAEQAEALKDQLRLLGSQQDRLQEDETELFAAVDVDSMWPAGIVAITHRKIWAEYDTESNNLRAKLESLKRETTDLADIGRRIKEYRDDIQNLNRQIKNTGVAEEIIMGLPAVTLAEEELWRARSQNLKRQLTESEEHRNNAKSLVDKAVGAHEAAMERVIEQYGRTPVSWPEIDLNEHRAKLVSDRQRIQADLNELADRRGFVQELRRNYQMARDDLLASGMSGDQALPWDFSLEQDKLRCSLEAPVEVVRLSQDKLKQAKDEVGVCCRRWIQAVEAMETQLEVLDNMNINRFFNQLKTASRQPGWEQHLDEVKASLTHVEKVIVNVQSEAKRRLDDADRVLAEMVERAFRQADNILQQLQELQSSSKVSLRGQGVPLIKADFTRPEAIEGQERIKQYLEQVIAQTVEQKKAGTKEEDYRQGLAQAVRSSALVSQLVPLEGIRFKVLKPCSDEQPYAAGDYHNWDTLINWSEGQRYAARFAVFVVLMFHLRQKLSPGQESSVIIADNPFGGASSGHILEIVMAVAKQTKTQLFCVTAHRQTEIMREFNVLYSLVFRRTLSGQERMVPVDETPDHVHRTGIEAAWANVPGSPYGTDLGGQLRLLPF